MSENYRYSIIPAGAITDSRLEPRDLQVLCLLGRHTNDGGWCFRSQVRMAREIDCGRSSVQRSIDRLVDAGWIAKKLRSMSESEPDPARPHAAYAYRVLLDQEVINASQIEKDSTAEPEPPNDGQGVPTGGQGVPTGGQGVPTYAWAHEPSLVNKDEREGRECEKEDKRLTKLKSKWPTTAHDDQARIDREWAVLPEDERDDAVDRAADFIADAKKAGRKHVPALWKYLEERRWKLLKAKVEAAQAASNNPNSPAIVPRSSEAGRALAVLGKIARYTLLPIGDGWSFKGDIGARILAFASAPPESEWHVFPRGDQHFWSWWKLVSKDVFPSCALRELTEIRAPWPWPPSIEGKIYTADSTGPPGKSMAEQDAEFIEKHGLG